MSLKRNAVKAANIAPNAVTSSKVKNGSLLAKDFKAGQLPKGAKGDQGPVGAAGAGGAAGAAGAPGATGQKGDKGDSATALFASVNPDGTLRAGSGVTGVTRYPGGGLTGDYLVTFNRDITGCAWTGTLAHANAAAVNRSINLEAFPPGSANGAFRIEAPPSTADFSFDVAVFC